ncbi:MAG: hypothetical protein ACE363_15410 [Alphaproteobacteria bacterium]
MKTPFHYTPGLMVFISLALAGSGCADEEYERQQDIMLYARDTVPVIGTWDPTQLAKRAEPEFADYLLSDDWRRMNRMFTGFGRVVDVGTGEYMGKVTPPDGPSIYTVEYTTDFEKAQGTITMRLIFHNNAPRLGGLSVQMNVGRHVPPSPHRATPPQDQLL